MIGVLSCCAISFSQAQDTISSGNDFEFLLPFKTAEVGNTSVYYTQAQQYFANKNYEPALALIKKAIKQDKVNADFYLLKAWILSAQGNTKSALQTAEKAVNLQPESWKPLYCLAYCKQTAADYLGAVIAYTQVLQKKPDHSLSLSSRAKCKEWFKEFTGAIEDYSAAIKLQNTEPKLYAARANLYFKMQLYDAAIVDFTTCMLYDKSNAEVLYYRALCYVEKKDFENACIDFAKANTLGYKTAQSEYGKYCK